MKWNRHRHAKVLAVFSFTGEDRVGRDLDGRAQTRHAQGCAFLYAGRHPHLPPADAQFCPNSSYSPLFFVSESTSWASDSSLKRASACLSPAFRSGWCLRASLRKADEISFCVAVRGTPSTS